MKKYWKIVARSMEKTDGDKLDPFEYIIVIVTAILLILIFGFNL